MMKPLEVTWVPDDTILPPGPKMVACIVPAQGWFFRINTADHWRPNVPLVRLPDHPFLKHDIHLECQILELDDFVIAEALRKTGVIGSISPTLTPMIRAAVRQNRSMDNTEKAAIHAAMQAV